MPLGVLCVNKEDRWLVWEWVGHNLIKAMALAPRRTTEGLMIGLLFLICLMLTLKDIKKNVKRFLVFHRGGELFLDRKKKKPSLWLGHSVQPGKLICPNVIRRPFKAEVGLLCRQSIRDKGRLGFAEAMLGKTAVKCHWSSLWVTAYGA